jgi:hypothetical protein
MDKQSLQKHKPLVTMSTLHGCYRQDLRRRATELSEAYGTESVIVAH